MLMPPALRKFALTAHVAASVGWLGAVVAFLPLALLGRMSHDPQTVRGAYLGMEVIGWYALVPLAFASLLTGLVQGLGTRWGLIRHYWVLFKLVIAVLSTILLLSYTQTLAFLAGVAAGVTSPGAVPGVLRSYTAVVHASLALLALLVATTLSVYKPRGMTPYGQRRQGEQRRQPPAPGGTEIEEQTDEERSAGIGRDRQPNTLAPRWVNAFGIVFLVLILLIGVLLIAGGGDHGPRRHVPPAGHSPPIEHTPPAEPGTQQP